jgi:hypothetical protein
MFARRLEPAREAVLDGCLPPYVIALLDFPVQIDRSRAYSVERTSPIGIGAEAANGRQHQ